MSVLKSETRPRHRQFLIADYKIEYDRQIRLLSPPGNQILDGFVAIPGNFSASEQCQERLNDFRRIHSLERENQVRRPATKIEPRSLDLWQPDRGELAECQPQTVFEERIDRPIERE